jgi:hypothetical protein
MSRSLAGAQADRPDPLLRPRSTLADVASEKVSLGGSSALNPLFVAWLILLPQCLAWTLESATNIRSAATYPPSSVDISAGYN